MSAPLSAEEREHYARAIDQFLRAADLQTVTRKKVRQALEHAVGKNLDDQKFAVKMLMEERFDVVRGSPQGAIPTPPDPTPTPSSTSISSKGVKRGSSALDDDNSGDGKSNTTSQDASASASDHEDEEPDEPDEPPKKKQRTKKSSMEAADARLAAQLQAQENSLVGRRVTRGGNAPGKSKKASTKAKTSRVKSSRKIKADDDSDLDSDARAQASKRKAGGGLQQMCDLSEQMQAIVFASQLPRTQVVKKIWEYIRANDLQDPNDKRVIICDEKMLAIFKQPTVTMFSLNKYLKPHLYPVEKK